MVITKTNNIPKIAAELQPKVEALLERVAKHIVDRAKELVPVSDKSEDGHVHLRDTITAEVRGLLVEIVAGKDYAPYVEWGTRFMAARPFMAPAVREGQDILMAGLAKIFEV